MNMNQEITHKSQKRASIINKSIILLIFSISSIVSLVLLEFSVRYLFPDLLQCSPCYQYHPRRYWTLCPNSHVTYYFRGPNGKIEWSFPLSASSQGLRDRYYGPKEKDEYRILMLGDSVVYGHGVAIEDSIPKRLEVLLKERCGVNVSVINGAIGMYCPWQSRDLLNEIGFSFEPDIVMFGLFSGNDISDTMYHHGLHQKAYIEKFYLRRLLLANRKYWNFECEYVLRRYWQTFNAFGQYLNWPKEGSLARVLGYIPFGHPYVIPKAEPSLSRNSLLELNLVSWYPELEKGYEIMWQDIAGIKADSVNHNIDFLFFTIPHMEIVYDSKWDELSPVDNYDRDKLQRIINSSAKENNIKVIPVMEGLFSIDQKQSFYIPNDGHLNEDGCEFVADILFNYLQKNIPTLNLKDSTANNNTNNNTISAASLNKNS